MSNPIPFSPEHEKVMAAGDQFETEGVFLGVADQKLHWKIVAKTGPDVQPLFFLEARYFGVYFGTFTFARGKLVQERLA